MRTDRAIFWELERAATSPWPDTPQETPPPIAEGGPLMENNAPPQPVKQIGPNIAKVFMTFIVSMAAVAISAIVMFALRPEPLPVLIDATITAVTPAVAWARDMGANAFYMAIGGAGGGGVTAVWKSRKG